MSTGDATAAGPLGLRITDADLERVATLRAELAEVTRDLDARRAIETAERLTAEVDRLTRPLGSHIEARWTWPGHFAHDAIHRGHLPQLCVVASGWRARVLGWIFRAGPRIPPVGEP